MTRNAAASGSFRYARNVHLILNFFWLHLTSHIGVSKLWIWSVPLKHKCSDYSRLGSAWAQLQSIRVDETVNVNKPSPVSPQLTARSGQGAQLVQVTHCILTHVNLHSDFGHPCNCTPITRSLHDFILRAKEISRAFVYDDFLVSANGL
jgi:hypothetical protein